MLTEKDWKILNQIPRYDGNPEHYVGSREYWANIFMSEKNRDTELHAAFAKLHNRLVDEVIRFCKEHDLNVDEFTLHANGILGSKQEGKWTCHTDSSMEMIDMVHDENFEMDLPDRENPFLFRA